MIRRLACAVVLTLLASIAGCDGQSSDTVESLKTVESQSQRGPMQLDVVASRDAMTVGDTTTVTIEFVAPSHYDVEMPQIREGDALGEFTVRTTDRPPDVPEGDMRHWRHAYVIDTFTPGALEVPAFEVAYAPGEDAPEDAASGVLSSDPLTITVASVLAPDESELDFRDIKPETEASIEGPARRWMPIVIGAIVAAIVGAVVTLLLRRIPGSAPAPEPVIPPGEWAEQALATLEAEGHVSAGRFETFYDRLSGIVREYVERRFGLMAPERTTDEFLREAGQSGMLTREHRGLLEQFLRAADMVKFARQSTTADECANALDAARAFVRDTAGASVGEDVAC